MRVGHGSPSLLLHSGCFGLSCLYIDLLFTVNIPSSRHISLQNRTAKQTSPGITRRAGQTLARGPKAGPDPTLPDGGTHPTALPPWCPQESLPCWAPARSFPSLCQHLARKRSESHKTHLQAWFHSPPKHQAPRPLSVFTKCSLWTHLSLTGYLELSTGVFRYCSGHTAARGILFLTCELRYLHIPSNLFLTF